MAPCQMVVRLCVVPLLAVLLGGGGLSAVAVGLVQDVSGATVRRDGRIARAWLYRQLDEAGT